MIEAFAPGGRYNDDDDVVDNHEDDVNDLDDDGEGPSSFCS